MRVFFCFLIAGLISNISAQKEDVLSLDVKHRNWPRTRAGRRTGGSEEINLGYPYPKFYGASSLAYKDEGNSPHYSVPIGLPFEGREYGGGSRQEIYGTARYGSGYPYRVGGTLGVAGQPFPFGFWPINWVGAYSNYGGGLEYAISNQTYRPGQYLAVAKLVASPDSGWNTTGSEEYWMIGDLDTVTSLEDYLSRVQCGTIKQEIVLFDRTIGISPGNIIQWYRASSFALASTDYNNAYAYAPLNSTTDLTLATSLPETQRDSSFLQCLNQTIGATLPIIKKPDHRLNEIVIIGAIVGSILGFILLLVGLRIYSVRLKQKKSREEEPSQRQKTAANGDTLTASWYRTTLGGASVVFPKPSPVQSQDDRWSGFTRISLDSSTMEIVDSSSSKC